MSFITDFIASMMEDPQQNAKDTRRMMKSLEEGAAAYREKRAAPLRMASWWNQPERSSYYESEKLACEGPDGKGTKYMATPGSRANSIQAILDTYEIKERRNYDAAQAAKDSA
mmetsp:Transcript_14429/g.27934  ORF Transcript_14429/g.27934 Transcript_14429/m.27934 type:complete len:113 (+) Transcript_14429:97-435(+)|eukprot:CAMPEP_0171496890 /NCGR_PEP_ID=MMETSP0958-20121227/6956_1 /TAXON_ID=87120 /ORGANISM="Aurantiochytrium limacinum, Strain ATCCMYA-1381" /LENGTH=112 /DNA_ID=CAMNT_0012031049 /DNA_START=90 /DNA_END=428 /DNA_ORIENTATION=-